MRTMHVHVACAIKVAVSIHSSCPVCHTCIQIYNDYLKSTHHVTFCPAVMCKQRMLRRQLHFKQRSMHSTRSRRSMGRASWCRPRPLPSTQVLAMPPEAPLLPLDLTRTGTEASVLADALLLPMCPFQCICSPSSSAPPPLLSCSPVAVCQASDQNTGNESDEPHALHMYRYICKLHGMGFSVQDPRLDQT